MTVQGTVGKTFVLLAILLATAAWAWNAAAGQTLAIGLLADAGIGGFIVAMITMFKPTVAPWTAPLYAALEGVLLGAISQVVEMRFHGRPGIALQAVTLTCGVLFIMLFVYATRLIRVTEKLRMGIVVATSALCLFYLIAMLLSFFGVGDAAGLQRDQVRDRLQPVRGRSGGVQPAAGLRLHREGRRDQRPQVHGVVRCLRPDGHADLAVPGDPPAAR